MSVLLTDHGRLALAIYQRDFDSAAQVLSEMECRSSKWALAAQAARRTINPPAPLPPVTALQLPIAGGEPGKSFLGDNATQRVRKVA